MRRRNQPEEGGSSQHHDADPLTNSRRNNEGGNHIDSVKEQVPPDQWCDKDHTDEEYANAEKKSGFFGSYCR